MNDDDSLRHAFQSLRAEDRLRLPRFDEILRRRRRDVRAPHWQIRLAVSALTLVVAIVVLEVRHRPSPSDHIDRTPSILIWRAPTDFLLDTAGSQLMRTVPLLGEPVVPQLMTPPAPSVPGGPPRISPPETSS